MSKQIVTATPEINNKTSKLSEDYTDIEISTWQKYDMH